MTDPQKHDGITASLNARISRLEERNEEKTSELGRLQDELRRVRGQLDEACAALANVSGAMHDWHPEREVPGDEVRYGETIRAWGEQDQRERGALREECERLRGALQEAEFQRGRLHSALTLARKHVRLPDHDPGSYAPPKTPAWLNIIDAALAPRAPTTTECRCAHGWRLSCPQHGDSLREHLQDLEASRARAVEEYVESRTNLKREGAPTEAAPSEPVECDQCSGEGYTSPEHMCLHCAGTGRAKRPAPSPAAPPHTRKMGAPWYRNPEQLRARLGYGSTTGAAPPRDEPPPARDESPAQPMATTSLHYEIDLMETLAAAGESYDADALRKTAYRLRRLAEHSPAPAGRTPDWRSAPRDTVFTSADRMSGITVAELVEMEAELERLRRAPAGRTAELERVETLAAKVWNLRSLLARCVKYAREDRMVTPGATRLARALDEAELLLAKAPDPGPEPAELPAGKPGALLFAAYERLIAWAGMHGRGSHPDATALADVRALLREPAPAAELPALPEGWTHRRVVAREGWHADHYDFDGETRVSIYSDGSMGFSEHTKHARHVHAVLAHHLGREPAKGG